MDITEKMIDFFKRYAIYILFFGILLLAFSTRVGDGWYFHNDGVTLACSMENIIDLIHPGKWEVKGCTYDHQPLYLLMVKFVSFLTKPKLVIFQWINVIFFIGAWLLMVRTLTRQNKSFSSILLAGAITFFFLSSMSLLYWIQELRMYGFYLFSCFYVISEIERIGEDNEPSFIQKAFHIIHYFNFFLYLVPFSAYIVTLFRVKKRKIKKTFYIFLSAISALVLVKLPYIFWWRVMSRSGGLQNSFSDITSLIERDLFQGKLYYVSFANVLFAVGLLFSFKRIKDFKTQAYLFLLLITLIIFIITSLILNMHEIELRYFLFIYAIIIVFAYKALVLMKNKWLRVVFSLVLISISIVNSTQMYQRGVSKGREIKTTAEFVAKILRDENFVLVDDPYFYHSYVGVYSSLINDRKAEVRDIKKFSGLDQQKYYISVLESESQHLKQLENLKVKYHIEGEIIYNQRNFLNSWTIVSRLKSDKNLN